VGDSSVMEMDGMSSSVMVLRFCATQLPWPLTRVIPILPSSILHPPSSILHPPSSIFHSLHILLCFRTTQTPRPANRSSPFPPPPPPPSPSPRRTSLRSASSAFARPDPRPAAALVFAWIWWWVGGGSLAGLCNWGG